MLKRVNLQFSLCSLIICEENTNICFIKNIYLSPFWCNIWLELTFEGLTIYLSIYLIAAASESAFVKAHTFCFLTSSSSLLKMFEILIKLHTLYDLRYCQLFNQSKYKNQSKVARRLYKIGQVVRSYPPPMFLPLL